MVAPVHLATPASPSLSAGLYDSATSLAASAGWGAAMTVTSPLVFTGVGTLVPAICGYKCAQAAGAALKQAHRSLFPQAPLQPPALRWNGLRHETAQRHFELVTSMRSSEEAFVQAFGALNQTEQGDALVFASQPNIPDNLLNMALTQDFVRAFRQMQQALLAQPATLPWIAYLVDTWCNDTIVGKYAWDANLPGLALLGVSSDTARKYVTKFPQAQAQHRELIEKGILLPDAYLRANPNPQLTIDMVLTYRMDLNTAISLNQPAVNTALVDLLQDDPQALAQLCTADAIPSDVAVQLAEDGKLSAMVVLENCDISNEVAMRWCDSRRITPLAYLNASLSRWQPEKPLPEIHVAYARAFGKNVAGLWSHLADANMNQFSSSRRASYIVRMTACALNPPVVATPQDMAPAGPSCVVCDEAFSRSKPALRSASCQHAADTCAACVGQNVVINNTPTCPSFQCTAELSANDLLAARVAPTTIDAVLKRTVVRKMNMLPGWQNCPAFDCMGGAQVPAGEVVKDCCPLCHKKRVLAARQVDRRRDTEYLARLIHDMRGDVNDASGSPTMNGLIRECYGCGIATEHRADCAHMACKECGAQWDFVRGLQTVQYARRRRIYPLEQSYVPKAGLLVDAGLYEGLELGSVNHPESFLLEHVSRLARAKGLLPSKTKSDAH